MWLQSGRLTFAFILSRFDKSLKMLLSLFRTLFPDSCVIAAAWSNGFWDSCISSSDLASIRSVQTVHQRHFAKQSHQICLLHVNTFSHFLCNILMFSPQRMFTPPMPGDVMVNLYINLSKLCLTVYQLHVLQPNTTKVWRPNWISFIIFHHAKQFISEAGSRTSWCFRAFCTCLLLDTYCRSQDRMKRLVHMMVTWLVESQSLLIPLLYVP